MKKQNKLNYNMQNEDTDYEPDLFLGYHEKQRVLSEITVPLDEEIKAPKYYRHVLARINDLEEGDSVLFELRTVGGDLRGITALIHAVQSTPADVHCHIDTEADSAGSLFALNCPSISVAPWAKMMIHTGQGISAGTMLNKAAYSNFMETELNKMMREAYTGFLTEEELNEVFLGKEFWFNAEQIIERLNNRQEYFKASQEACDGSCEDCNCTPKLPQDWDKE